MSWIQMIMATNAVCGVLAGGVTSSAFAAEDGHIQEVITHTDGSLTHAEVAHEKRMHEMMSGTHGAMPGRGH